MYLTGLKLSNYRSFHKQNFDFSKITLLLGPNSGGKTSVLAAILSCLQSQRFPAYLSPNGSLVETGDYREIVKSHRVSDNISVGIEFGKASSDSSESKGVSALSGVYERDPKTSMPILYKADFSSQELTWSISKARDKYKLKWLYSPKGETAGFVKKFPEFAKAIESIAQAAATLREKESSVGGGRRNKAIGNNVVANTLAPAGEVSESVRISDLPSIFDFSAENRDPKDFWAFTALSASKDCVSNFAKNFSYLGSHRIPPQRTYYHLVGPDLKVGVGGQNTIEQILAWENSKNENLDALRKALKLLGLASGLKANRLSGSRFEVTVKATGSAVNSSIADVGFGVNQFLPILVSELQMKDGATIAISQPETHLHPSIQANMATHFVENIKKRNFRYLIETHSEYFFNRLRRLVVLGEIAPEDVSVYYMEQVSSGASVHKIVFEKNGKITGAPTGFFATYQVDVMNIALKR